MLKLMRLGALQVSYAGAAHQEGDRYRPGTRACLRTRVTSSPGRVTNFNR
jgi:hypothetical protein